MEVSVSSRVGKEGLTDMVTFDQRFEAGGRVCQAGRTSTKIPGWACAWLAKGTALWLCRGKEESRVG